MWLSRRFVSVAVVMALSSRAGADVLTVDDDAPPGGDGLGWETAYRFLQDALANALPNTEIRVAQGTYRPDLDEAGNVIPGDRAATFQLISGVSLKGGFAGIGAPVPDQRDITLFESILSGDLQGDDDGFLNNGENSYHVVTASSTDDTCLLEGFTITAGNANFAPSAVNGGGMLVETGSPAVAKCTFSTNSATNRGGALFNSNSNLHVTSCTFAGNRAIGPRVCGGAIDSIDSNPVVSDCLFIGNSAFHLPGGLPVGTGGAMCSYVSSHTTIANCIFIGNSASYLGGAVAGGPMTVTGCTFTGNSAAYGGGLKLGSFGGPNTDQLVANCSFVGNHAISGGGLFNGPGGSPVVINCTFDGNGADHNGGAVFNDHAGTAMINCTFSSNTAASHGGAMVNSECSPAITNCSFSGNSSALVGGTMLSGGAAGRPTVVNCILWGTTGLDEIVDAHGSLTTVLYSNVQSGWPGLGNVDANPLFADPGNGDLRLSPGSPCIDAGNNDLVPQGITTDLDGNPRYLDVLETPDTGNGVPPIVDMGAYEALGGGCLAIIDQEVVCHADGSTFTVNVEGLNACTGGTTTVSFTVSGGAVGEELCFTVLVDDGGFCCTTEVCVIVPDCSKPAPSCDLDGDGIVGALDFLALLSAWGACSDCGDCPADFNDDCEVGVPDMLTLLEDWTA